MVGHTISQKLDNGDVATQLQTYSMKMLIVEKTIREMRVSCWRSFWQETNARTRASKPNRGRCGACLGHAGLCWFPWQLHGSSKLPAAEGRSVFCRILVFMTIYASIFSKLRFYAVYLHVYAHVIYLRFIFIFVFTSWALGIFSPQNFHWIGILWISWSRSKKKRTFHLEELAMAAQPLSSVKLQPTSPKVGDFTQKIRSQSEVL